jgi:hypothetical protein
MTSGWFHSFYHNPEHQKLLKKLTIYPGFLLDHLMCFAMPALTGHLQEENNYE